MIPKKKEASSVQYTTAPCDLGWFIMGTTATGLCFLALGDSAEALVKELAERFPRTLLVPALQPDTLPDITAIINGQRREVALPLDLQGTPFQLLVWDALKAIPYGSTLSYSELARQIGRPKSARAVANGCGANPVGIIIPCHRVIRSDGSLGGYRGGVERKKLLLEREQQT